jgi:hypothetical protein
MSETTYVEAQVICAGVSYFVREPVMDAGGEQRKNPADNSPVFFDKRRDAKMGDIISLSPAEFDRLAREGCVRTPDSSPLPGDGVRYATPFSQPAVVEGDNSPIVPWVGPVMGDPNPGAEVGGLTVEEALELQRKADGAYEHTLVGEVEGGGTGDGEPLDVAGSSEEEVAAYIQGEGLNVGQTLALAKEDDEYDEVLADRVLKAELSTDKPRDGVVGPLQKVLGEE